MVIRPPFADEREYILRSWIESYRYAPGQRKRRWRDYESEREREFNEIFDRRDTVVLVKAIDDGDEDVILGWMCYAHGTHADAVHWVFARYRESPIGAVLRRRGTMRELVEAARLKPHVAYTFRGALPRGCDEGQRVSSDEWIVPWLMRRGIGAAYLPYREWSGR